MVFLLKTVRSFSDILRYEHQEKHLNHIEELLAGAAVAPERSSVENPSPPPPTPVLDSTTLKDTLTEVVESVVRTNDEKYKSILSCYQKSLQDTMKEKHQYVEELDALYDKQEGMIDTLQAQEIKVKILKDKLAESAENNGGGQSGQSEDLGQGGAENNGERGRSEELHSLNKEEKKNKKVTDGEQEQKLLNASNKGLCTDSQSMDITETGAPEENPEATLARDMKTRLSKTINKVREMIEVEESSKEDGEHSILRSVSFNLKPTKDGAGPVSVEISSKDTTGRTINIEALDIKDNKDSPHTEVTTPNLVWAAHNTLNGDVFLDSLKRRVFPFLLNDATKSTVYHPEYLRSSFSRHFVREDGNLTGSQIESIDEKREYVKSVVRSIEYSLFNKTFSYSAENINSGSRSVLSRLIYIVFEHDMGVVRHMSEILANFRAYACERDSIINLSSNNARGPMVEATVATVFTLVLPLISSTFSSKIAEALSEPTPR